MNDNNVRKKLYSYVLGDESIFDHVPILKLVYYLIVEPVENLKDLDYFLEVIDESNCCVMKKYDIRKRRVMYYMLVKHRNVTDISGYVETLKATG